MAGQSHFFGYYFVLSVIHASSCSQTMCYVPNRRVSKPGEVVIGTEISGLGGWGAMDAGAIAGRRPQTR